MEYDVYLIAVDYKIDGVNRIVVYVSYTTETKSIPWSVLEILEDLYCIS